MWDISAIINKSNQRIFVDFFHSLPHLNMWFAKSNSTFDPNNSDYLETILFWSTVPILFLILILLVLILYACCLVCSSNQTHAVKFNKSYKKTKTYLKQFKCVLGLFIILLSISLGFLVFGSETFHYSFYNVTANIKNFSEYFGTLGNQTRKAKDMILLQINSTNEIANILKECSQNKKDCPAETGMISNFKYQQSNKLAFESLKELSSIKQSLNDSYNSLEILNQIEYEKNAYLHLISQIEVAEQTRWGIMIGVVTINMLLVTLLFIGLIKNSKGSLCFFAFAGVLSLISIWVLNALYLGVTVFIADYCTSPDQYILTIAEKNHMKNLVHYYTTCYSSSSSNGRSNLLYNNNKYTPFKLDLNRAESKLRTAATLYSDNFVSMSQSILGDKTLKKYNFQEAIINIETILDSIRTMIRCDQTSMNYKQAIYTLCNNSIFGLSLVIISSIAFGLIMPVLICIIPQMWRKMHNKEYYDYHRNSNGSNGDDTHPFLSSSNNGGNSVAGQIRTNISAARQFNESPSFQRLPTNSSTNSNFNSLGRNKHSTLRHNTSNNNNNSNSTNNYAATLSYNQTKLNRVNEFVVNTDPYLMLNSTPSAPPQINAYQSYYTQINTSMGREHYQ